MSAPTAAATALTKAQIETILGRYTATKRRGDASRDAKHDEASKEIFRSLEDNTAYFLESVKDRITRYEENLREVIKIRYPKAMSGHPLDTPLLRRTAMASMAIGAEDEPTPEQKLITDCPKITIKLLRERFAATYGDNYSDADMDAAMEALAKRNNGKRNRDGTINTNPAEEIDPSVPRPGKTLKAASRGGAGGAEGGEEGQTITLDPNDPAVLKAIIAALMAAKKEKESGGSGKKGGKESKLTAAALAAAAAAAGGGAGGAEEGDDGMYEGSDASSGLDIAEGCEAPEIELPDHSPLVKAYAALKKECYELDITFQGIHDWIMFNVQTSTNAEEREREIEVAEGIVQQVQEIQTQIGGIYEQLGTYLETRVEAEVEVLNYPHVTSYAQYLLSADDDAWFEVERSWRELVRATLFVYYLVANNLESLVAVASPTTASSYSLYY